MQTYSFTMEVGGIDVRGEDFEDRFPGVGDALIYVSGGRLFLAFDRAAPDEEIAVDSAARDIRECGGSIVKIIRESRDDLPWAASSARALPLSG